MANEQVQAVARQALNLSYRVLRDALPKAPEILIQDLFNKQSNINDIASLSDSQTDQIGVNTGNISTNTTNISTNTTNISTNATNITSVTDNFNTHNASNSQHGVTGNNVGTGDFAQASVGGVVFIAVNVADATASTVSVDSPDATDLPTVITLANETKADLNQLVIDVNAAISQLNALLLANKNAKQMVP